MFLSLGFFFSYHGSLSRERCKMFKLCYIHVELIHESDDSSIQKNGIQLQCTDMFIVIGCHYSFGAVVFHTVME